MDKRKFESEIRTFIEAEQLLRPGAKVVVALSGGADSVALLRVLLALGYQVVAAHCNFHLRAAESDRDEAFVRTLCRTLDVPLRVISFDTSAYARVHGVSIEMAAREQRYAWFEALRLEEEAEAVAVAHHRDDHVETLLLNLVRGTGLHGLTGIASRRDTVVRPLLGVGRADILDYLSHLRQPYVTDSTNLEDTYRRNKIRLRLMPLLQELNPSVAETLAATADRLRQAEAVYARGIEEGKARVMPDPLTIRLRPLMGEPSPKALLHEILHPYGFNTAQEEAIFASILTQPGRRFQAPEWELLRDREAFILRARTDEAPPEVRVEVLDRTPEFQIPRDKHAACLDADRVTQPLSVRHPRPGDRFVPYGMRGSKLLSDYFTDRKFTAFEKERQWVVCSGDDIVWLADERPDGRYCVTPSTRRVMLLRLIPR